MIVDNNSLDSALAGVVLIGYLVWFFVETSKGDKK